MPARSSSSAEARQSRRPSTPSAAATSAAAAPTPVDSPQARRRLRVGVLALDGMMLSTYGSVVDTLLIAQRVADIQMPGLMDFQAVLELSGHGELAHRLTPDNWRLRYHRWIAALARETAS